MLTPSKYWRVHLSQDERTKVPASTFALPRQLAEQSSPPLRGHGIAIASYDNNTQTGLLSWVGIIVSVSGVVREIDWRPTSAEIWIDSPKGRSYWLAGSFGFASKKNADYGLHELWQEHFEGLELRDSTPMGTRPSASRSQVTSRIASERLNPVEVIGQVATGERAGVVYLLKSAYGYKVGRTRNVPARMRAFGIQLPFLYTIPFCAWFDDCHAAEKRYHHLFATKRINGEWFNLDEHDILVIRQRA